MWRLLPILVLLLAACGMSQRRRVLRVEPLAAAETGRIAGRALIDASDESELENWPLFEIAGSVNSPELSLQQGILHIRSDSGAGVFYRRVSIDPSAEPLLTWRWRVSRTYKSGSTPLIPELDNFPARLLVGFESGWEDAGPLALDWKRSVEKVTGLTPPARAICYTFGGRLGADEAVDAFFGQGALVVVNLRPQDSEPDAWYSEVRDINADYRAVFGEAPPRVSAIGLSCDSHLDRLVVEADFADITVFPRSAYSQFAGELSSDLQHRPAPLATLLAALFGAAALVLGGLWFWMRRERDNPNSETQNSK